MDKQKGRVVQAREEDHTIADPGTAQAIPVGKSGQVPLVIADAVETNTLAAPAFKGQELTLYAYSVAGSGTRAVTASARVNVAAETIMTFDTAGDLVVLKAIDIGGNLRWEIIANDGVALS